MHDIVSLYKPSNIFIGHKQTGVDPGSDLTERLSGSSMFEVAQW